MNKVEVIARRILGWKLNRWDCWYDFENNKFIYDSEFQPEYNLEHAMLIVKQLEMLGYTFKVDGHTGVYFNDQYATGETLAQAITNAAYLIADNSSIPDGWL
jgi:hypothetical protein